MKKPLIERERFCSFCVNAAKEIDYKNIQQLQRFISNYSKILPRKRTGACAKHQRKLAKAIKRARFMGLVPFTNR